VDAIARVLPEVAAPDVEVLWQTGVTDATGLDIDARDKVPAKELREAIAAADLVVAHAGIGSALTALDLGKCPVLLSRRQSQGEHVDDHQLMIAGELARRGLAVSRDPAELSGADLMTAMRTAISADDLARPFRLDG
jgi:UDP-N-acetylglucosamine transferase subunit ALG13